MKRTSIVLVLFVAFFAGFALVFIANQPSMLSSLAATGDVTSDIAAWMAMYGTYHLPTELQEQMHAAFSPVSIPCGDVTVTLSELLYDGEWMYTAAKIVPNDPEKTLVLPGGAAQPGESVCGINGEYERDDMRTFRTAAKEDGKQLLAVYVYPKEYDTVGSYFLDYFQRANDVSVLVSGAQLAGGNLPITITWQIQIYDVDLDTQQYALMKQVTTEPVTLAPIRELTSCTYEVVSEDAPFDSVELIESALHTYIRPSWQRSEDAGIHLLTLFDASGQAYPGGAAPDVNTAVMDSDPERLYLSLDGAEMDRLALVRMNPSP